jgi:hypothetical protein
MLRGSETDVALSATIKSLSRSPAAAASTVIKHSESLRAGLTARQAYKTAKTAIDLALEHTQRRRWMKSRSAILLGVAIERSSLKYAERVLFDSSMGKLPRRTLLELLRRTEALNECFPILAERLTTYENLDAAQRDHAGLLEWYEKSIRARPASWIKAALASANMVFALPLLSGIQQHRLRELLPDVARTCGSERWAEIVSRFIAEAVTARPLRHEEICLEVVPALRDPNLSLVLTVAAIRQTIGEYAKHAQQFGYSVQRLSHRDALRYVLLPPSEEFERHLRMGHVARDDRAYAAWFDHEMTGDVRVRFGEAARLFALSLPTGVAEVVPQPFRRIQVGVPEVPDVYKAFLNVEYVDDAVERQHYLLNLVAKGEALEATEVASNLRLLEYLRLYRATRFFCLFHLEALAVVAGSDAELLANSMVPVLQESAIRHILKSVAGATLSDDELEAFLRIIRWPRDAHQHLDLQYTPYIRTGKEGLLCPAVLANSAGTRNVLASTSRRVLGAGKDFEEIVGKLFEVRFPQRVSVGRTIRHSGEEAEIDVAVLGNGHLYLLECKHSLSAATAHEHRDLWEDIHKAVDQLTRAVRLLRSDLALGSRLQDWFSLAPLVESADRLVFVPAVVTSARMFSGQTLKDIPVRDFFSLENVIHRGTIEFTRLNEQELITERFSYWANEYFHEVDLLDYLDGEGSYWRLRRQWFSEATYFDLLSEPVAFARRTFVTSQPRDSNEARRAALAHGLRALPERRRPMFEDFDASDFLESRQSTGG